MRVALLLALSGLIPAAPAAALTPEEVVADWRADAARWGTPYEVELEERADGSLLVRNVAPAPPGSPAFMAEGSPLREVLLVPLADGSVEIRGGMGERFDLPLAPGGPALRIEGEDPRFLARDGAAGIDYDYAARALRIVLLPPPDRPHDAPGAEFALEMSDVAVRLPARGETGDGIGFDLELSASGLAYLLGSHDPVMGRTGGWARVEAPRLLVSAWVPASAMGFFAAMEGREPSPAEAGQMLGAALADGMAIRFDLASAATTGASWADAGLFPLDYSVSGGPGWSTYAINRAGLLFSGAGEGMAATVSTPALPWGPVELGLGPVEWEFRLPLFAREPEDFRVHLSLEEVSVGEATWDALDPGGALPRGPMRLAYDLQGRVALDLFGLLEAEAAGRVPPPPRMDSLELRAFELSLLGAGASGSGAVTFDGAMLPTGSGMLTLSGLDGLLDAAVALGMATPQDLVPLRLGLAAYFDPGEGAGEITSRIDIDGRTVTMNGVPLPLE